MCARTPVCKHLSTEARRGSDPLVLELQVNHLMTVLGTRLGDWKSDQQCNHRAVSPALRFSSYLTLVYNSDRG